MVRHNRLGLSILAILTVVGGSGCALQARSDVDTRASLSSCPGPTPKKTWTATLV